MLPGDVLGDRFEIERLAGEGGMGTVYRALDRVAGMPVAVKLLTAEEGNDERFAQEVRVLAELSHPAIVRYVAHGRTPHGQPFLVMEWLEGEDLSRRLSSAGLSVDDSLAVVRRVAEGLAAAHARHIVHRDVKPSNVLLIGGDPRRAKLLDFGIVRLQRSAMAQATQPMTRTGIVLGTVGYMSPEQVTADRALDARTDVFALGCLLFECLTGEPAFKGSHVVAVLAKVLREEAPRLRQLRPDMPAELDDLVAGMLCKSKTGRPADGGEVVRALDALGSVSGGAPESRPPISLGLSGGEQRLVSVMLAKIDPGESDRAREIVRRHEGDYARLANGSILVTRSGRGSTGEQAATDAVCALELREAFPSARIALVTGRKHTTDAGPPGPLIDRAAALLAPSTSPGIRVDDVTAGLLGERFAVRQDGTWQELLARREEAEPPRTLLGKRTPCVGRDKELELLRATLRECIDESVARAVVVTGPPGQGKSRLRYEFVHWARLRGDVAILTAWADPVGAGSAFVLVRQLVRRAVGLREGDPAVAQLTKLRSHVADIFRSGGDSGRIADFLGELLSVPSTDPPSQELRAARNDPQIMAAWLARSFGEWLAAECAARPLLIVLEDLHWGDMPSVAYLGDALRALASKPLMLLALGRPEMSDLFPKLWAGADKNEVSLGRLTRRASERLVRAALGDSVAADALARIVETADGNAFYLEELIRRVAEGGGESGGDSLPETVLALVQSRLERLEPEARRIVRAASVFGEVCWNGGVAELLGGPMAPGDLEGWLAVLAEREVLTLSPESRFPAEREYIFRHGLLREAAYAMLTEADRAAGHRLAGSWLEAAGEKDALTLADHFERGEEPKRAVPWLLRAAQAALDGGNTQAAIALGHRAIACRPVGAERGRIRQVQGRAHFVRGNLPESIEMSREAMDLLPVGSTLWFVSAAGAFFTGTLLGDRNVTAPVLKAILEVPTEPAPSGPYGFAVYVTCLGLALMAKLEFARSFLKRAEGVGPASDPDPVFVLYLRGARGFLEVMAGNVGGALTHLSEGRKLAERTGDVSGRANVAMITVEALAQTGDCERTEAALRDLLSLSEPRGLGALSDWGTLHVALARMNAHRADEAIASLSTLLDRSDRYLATCARAFLALAHAQVGDLVAATKEAKTSLEEGAAFPVTETVACGALALAELRRGHAQDALAFAERALDGESRAPWPSIGSSLILTRAEALSALGRVDDARAVIREARHRVLRIAGTLEPFPELRESCLTRIDTHVRTLELASEWLDGLEITE